MLNVNPGLMGIFIPLLYVVLLLAKDGDYQTASSAGGTTGREQPSGDN
ncbi:MAG: hypothetical protein R3E79_55885 [Caldilineaceae bacterium]